MPIRRDRYSSFARLAAEQREGVDYRIIAQPGDPRVAVIAPHGGGIEPGTSEIAAGIAGSQFSLYCFEGRKNGENGLLHVTSTRFDEPTCLRVIAAAETVLAVHGCEKPGRIAYLGGRDLELVQRLAEALRAAGFRTAPGSRAIAGLSEHNICNRGARRRGCMIEISQELRRGMFSGPRPQDRRQTTGEFENFVRAVSGALAQGAGSPAPYPTEENDSRVPSEVAMWHQLSGTPDNVTQDGQIVEGGAALSLRFEKELLRAAIEGLRAAQMPDETRSLAGLAASYLLAGDTETASRYVNSARRSLAERGSRDTD